MSIEINNVTKTWGDFVALDDVTVSLPTGQLTALLGPSGGGKSTLLRVIAGLETADTGTVSIEGVSLMRRILLAPARSRRACDRSTMQATRSVLRSRGHGDEGRGSA